MSLDKILSISGKPGLYQIVTQTRTGAVVESLLDQKRITVGPHSNISILSEIAIYTLSEEIPLREVLNSIKEKYKGEQSQISHKASKSELEEFFFEILPEYDEDRVYASDIKKVIQWYNILQKNNLLNYLEDKDNADTSEEE